MHACIHTQTGTSKMATNPGDCPLCPTKRAFDKMSALTGKERKSFLMSTLEQNMLQYRNTPLEARDSDLFIVTFSKCGTTWTQQIAKLVRNRGHEDGVDVDAAFPWIELMSPEEADVRNARTETGGIHSAPTHVG